MLFATGLWAGVQNALAGGGSFVTLPVLMLSGLDPRAANITSTVALFPGQASSGIAAWPMARGAGSLSLATLLIVSFGGGFVGGALLLLTPADFFTRLLPWLVMFATAAFAWGNYGPSASNRGGLGLKPWMAILAQGLISVYGGYFGGGIGFMMMAAFALSGIPTRAASASKNVLAVVINASAVALFVFSPSVHWLQAALLGAGAVLGGFAGVWIVKRLDERLLRLLVLLLGIALTIGLFARGA